MCALELNSKLIRVVVLFVILTCTCIKATYAATRIFAGIEQSVLKDTEILDPSHVVESRTVGSAAVCMRYCFEMTRCMSLSFNSDTNSCVFFDVVYGSGENGTPRANTHHYNVGEDSKCPVSEGYLHYRGINGCYRPQPTVNGLYPQAETHCYNEGAYLVKFDNVDEKIAIQQLIKASSYYDKSYWTGAHRDGPGDTWAWRDGSLIDHLPDVFRSGEPSGTGPCAYWDQNKNGLNDFSCSEPWPPVLCEKDVIS